MQKRKTSAQHLESSLENVGEKNYFQAICKVKKKDAENVTEK